MHQQSEQHGRYSHEPPTRRPPGEIPANRTQGDSARYAGRGGAAGGPARTVPSEPPNRRAVVDRDSNHNSNRSNGEGSNSNHNTERSPAHPSYAGKVASRDAGRSGASPAWERRRAPSGDEGSIFAPGTPNNRSQLRAGARGPEEPGQGRRRQLGCGLGHNMLSSTASLRSARVFPAPPWFWASLLLLIREKPQCSI
ncbi:hypothetical protein CY35_14G089500 [Sphagnum magellanicum]|nr:hypothetical protein CY35_14G089500 [Sphagnum magellanicum]